MNSENCLSSFYRLDTKQQCQNTDQLTSELRDGRTSGVTLPSTRPGAAGVMAKSPLSKRPKTPMELPGEDRGGIRERECVCEL